MSVPRHFRALAAELVGRGHRVVILVDGQRHDVVSADTNPAVLTWPSRRPTHLRDARFLFELIRLHRPACLVANFGSTNLMLTVGTLARVPTRICWYHTLSGQVDVDAAVSPITLKLLRWRKRLVYVAATHIVAVSSAAEADLRAVFGISPAKVTIFRNSLADPLAWPAAPRPSRSPRTIVCAGRLYPTKGQDVLIRAVAALKSRFPDCRVHFVGDGPARAQYENLAVALDVRDNCVFDGSLPADRVVALMGSSVATAVPSLIDNCPLVVIESLAVGTPVIASAVGGIIEMIDDGSEGFLVPPADPEALAERLARLLSNPEAAALMGSQARSRFTSQFELRPNVLRQADWLEDLAAGTPGVRTGTAHVQTPGHVSALPSRRTRR
jgi:glycosyltransferase involved in cell wall biosynthesis